MIILIILSMGNIVNILKPPNFCHWYTCFCLLMHLDKGTGHFQNLTYITANSQLYKLILQFNQMLLITFVVRFERPPLNPDGRWLKSFGVQKSSKTPVSTIIHVHVLSMQILCYKTH